MDDARPDRWGERVIRFLDKPPRLSLLEYLYFAGDARFGALGVSTSSEAYQPCERGPLPLLADTSALQHLATKVLHDEPIPESQRRLIAPGGTMGGARPKALIQIDDHPWVVKLDAGDPTDVPLVEHASMTLAREAGINVADTLAIPLPTGHATAIKRFDRVPGRRLHVLSANVALRAAGEELGYPELAQLLRRRGVAEGGRNFADMKELFRRMVFNILLDNTDDHEKNHAVIVRDSHQFQQMRVGRHGGDSTIENALSMCSLFGLKKKEAEGEVRSVAQVVSGGKEHFAACGVGPRDIDAYAQHIDRPFLREQRDAR